MFFKVTFGLFVIGISCSGSDDLGRFAQALYALNSDVPKKKLIDRLFEEGKLTCIGQPIKNPDSGFKDVVLQKIASPQQNAAECVANSIYNCFVLTMALSAPDDRVDALLAYFNGDKRSDAFNRFKNFLINHWDDFSLTGDTYKNINWLDSNSLNNLFYVYRGNKGLLADLMVNEIGFPSEIKEAILRMFNLPDFLVGSDRLDGIKQVLRDIMGSTALNKTAICVGVISPKDSDYGTLVTRSFNMIRAVTTPVNRQVLGFTMSTATQNTVGHNTCAVMVKEQNTITILFADSLSSSSITETTFSDRFFILPVAFMSALSIENAIAQLFAYAVSVNIPIASSDRAVKNWATMLKAFNKYEWLSSFGTASNGWLLYKNWMKKQIQDAAIKSTFKTILLDALV